MEKWRNFFKTSKLTSCHTSSSYVHVCLLQLEGMLQTQLQGPHMNAAVDGAMYGKLWHTYKVEKNLACFLLPLACARTCNLFACGSCCRSHPLGRRWTNSLCSVDCLSGWMRRFWWPHIKKTVRKFIGRCSECQHNQPRAHKAYGHMQPSTWRAPATGQHGPHHSAKKTAKGHDSILSSLTKSARQFGAYPHRKPLEPGRRLKTQKDYTPSFN